MEKTRSQKSKYPRSKFQVKNLNSWSWYRTYSFTSFKCSNQEHLSLILLN